MPYRRARHAAARAAVETLESRMMLEGGGISAAALPAAPANLRTSGVWAQTIDLRWDDNSGNEQGFRIAISHDGGANWNNVGETARNDVNFRVAGLTPDTPYSFKVRAYNADGFSPYTNTIHTRTVDVAPAAPSNLVATGVWAQTVDLAWTDHSRNEDGFRIAMSRDGVNWDGVGAVAANDRSFRVSGLQPATRYWFKVRAYNEIDFSAYTEPALEVVTRDVPPAAPTGLAAGEVFAYFADVHWADRSANEDGFRVLVSRDGVNFNSAGEVGPNVQSFRVPGLEPETHYWFVVRAFNEEGPSPHSNMIDLRTRAAAPPGRPTLLAPQQVRSRSVELAWSDGAGFEEHFNVSLSRDGGQTWDQVGQTGTGQHALAIAGLAPNSRYWFRVRGYNSGGFSEFSNVVEVVTDDAAPPSFSLSGAGGTQTTLEPQRFSWWLLGNPLKPVPATVIVYRNGTPVFNETRNYTYQTAGSSGGSFRFDRYGSGVYRIEVTAADADNDWGTGQTSWSWTRSVTVVPPPTPPQVTGAAVGGRVIRSGKALETHLSGQVDNALDFDGVDDYLEFAAAAASSSLGNFGLDDFTIEFLIKPEGPGRLRPVFSKRAACGYGNFWAISVLPDGRVLAEVSQDVQGTHSLQVPSSVSLDGGWHHVAVARQGTQLSIYVDGEPAGTGTAGGVANLDNDAALLAGRGPCPGGTFEGQLDELRIWKVALGAPAVALAARRGPVPTDRRGVDTAYQDEPGLAHYWPFDETGFSGEFRPADWDNSPGAPDVAAHPGGWLERHESLAEPAFAHGQDVSPPLELVVGFSEELAAAVTDPARWSLARSGSPVAITSVTFAYDQHTDRYRATLGFERPLAPGDYTLRAAGITDTTATPLDGDADGSAGGDLAIDFTLVGVGLPTTPYASPDGIQNDPAVAMTAAGRPVAVWAAIEDRGENATDDRDVQMEHPDSRFPATVNGHTALDQSWPAVAVNPAGDKAVVVWSGPSPRNPADNLVFAKVAPADAQSFAGEGTCQINTDVAGATGPQWHDLPDVAMDPAGNFVVVWQSEGAGGPRVHARHFDRNCVASDPFLVAPGITEEQVAPSIAMHADGTFVVAWTSGQEASADVYAQRFSAGGQRVGDPVLVNTLTSGSQHSASVAAGGGGRFVVAWAGQGPDGSSGVFGRVFTTDHPDGGPAFLVSEGTLNAANPDVAMTASGDLVVAWDAALELGEFAPRDVFVREYDYGATALGPAPLPRELWNRVNSYTANDQEKPAVAMDALGNYVVYWESYLQPVVVDGSQEIPFVLVYSRRYDVAAPNTPPVASTIPNITASEDADASADLWAAFADELDSDAALTYSVHSNSNAGLFTGTSVDPLTGRLHLDFAPHAHGSADLVVRALDSAGLWVDAPKFTVTVLPVNDRPSFAATPPASVGIGAGSQTVPNWAAFTPGPANESAQTVLEYTVSAVSNPALFSVPPAVSNDGTLTFTPAPGVSGHSTFTLVVRDSGGTDRGGVDTSTPQTFTITVKDLIPPSATISAAPLAPDQSAVDEVTLRFSEAVTGLDLADLTLRRGGGADLLGAGQTLTKLDELTWSLSGLSSLTWVKGDYELLVATGAEGSVADLAGNLLAGPASLRFTVDRSQAPASAGADQYHLRSATDGVELSHTSSSGPAWHYTLPLDAAGDLLFRTLGGDDTLLIDNAAGAFPAGITFDGGGGVNAVRWLTGASGVAVLTHLHLIDTALVVQAHGSESEAAAALSVLISTGRLTTGPHSPSAITGPAVVRNARGDGTLLFTSFAGQPVDASSVLVRGTYHGDTDLSGRIDIADYFAIDRGRALRRPGYANGDFDHDGGSPDADDFMRIDRAFLGQAGPQAPRLPGSVVAAQLFASAPIQPAPSGDDQDDETLDTGFFSGSKPPVFAG